MSQIVNVIQCLEVGQQAAERSTVYLREVVAGEERIRHKAGVWQKVAE